MDYRFDGPDDPRLDPCLLLGALVLVGVLAAGVFSSGAASRYVDPPGLLLVLGGTAGAVAVNHSARDVRRALSDLSRALRGPAETPESRIGFLVGLAAAVREEGPLVLDRESRRTDDPFFRLALELAAEGDGVPDLRGVLETERRASAGRAERSVDVLRAAAAYAPAMGLIGTLVGLIRMLGSLGDPKAVAPAMSLALVATLYGAVLSNLVLNPLAGKLRALVEEEEALKEITTEGVVSLARQEGAVAVEQRLRVFSASSPEHRAA